MECENLKPMMGCGAVYPLILTQAEVASQLEGKAVKNLKEKENDYGNDSSA